MEQWLLNWLIFLKNFLNDPEKDLLLFINTVLSGIKERFFYLHYTTASKGDAGNSACIKVCQGLIEKLGICSSLMGKPGT